MDDLTQIQVKFVVDTKYGQYHDALYYSLDQWPVDKAKLEADKQARVDSWITAITTPPPVPPDFTSDQLQAQADALTAQLEEVQSKIDDDS